MNTTLKVTNASAGMILKHGDTYDHPYVLTLKSVTVNGTEMLKSGEKKLSPYESTDVTLNAAVPTDSLVKVTAVYSFTFKDGTAYNGDITSTTFEYATNDATDVGTAWSKEDKKTNIYDVVKMKGETTTDYLVTNASALASAISNIAVTWTNQRDTDCKFTKGSISGFDSSIFESSGQAEALVSNSFNFPKESSISVNPLRVRSDVDIETVPSASSFALGNSSVTVYGKYRRQDGLFTFIHSGWIVHEVLNVNLLKFVPQTYFKYPHAFHMLSSRLSNAGNRLTSNMKGLIHILTAPIKTKTNVLIYFLFIPGGVFHETDLF